jgi:hypothetical protein
VKIVKIIIKLERFKFRWFNFSNFNVNAKSRKSDLSLIINPFGKPKNKNPPPQNTAKISIFLSYFLLKFTFLSK